MEGKDIVLLTRKEIREITGERGTKKDRKNCRNKMMEGEVGNSKGSSGNELRQVEQAI